MFKTEVSLTENKDALKIIYDRFFKENAKEFLTDVKKAAEKYVPIDEGTLRKSGTVVISDDEAALCYGSPEDERLNIIAIRHHEEPLFHYGDPPQRMATGAATPVTALRKDAGGAAKSLSGRLLYFTSYRDKKNKGLLKKYASKYLLRGITETLSSGKQYFGRSE
jgi:hypothetical protein